MRGQAFWTDTNKPIANLEVTLTLGESETKITTDTQGKYAFTELQPGAYTLSVIWEFGQFSALPCSNFSLKTPLEGSWMALTGTQTDGDHVLIAIGPEAKIAAGDRAEVNLEFSCN
ncbi:MAG: carboxypeptidase-like regulatory domain-containing protein [Anaerolineae bacterium]|nr:carboxypeptidase-like regulatory domain-containing protein [Anaerolineae bacterium]